MRNCPAWIIQANFTGLYVPSGAKPPHAIFPPGQFLFQHQWASDAWKGVSRMQIRVSDTTLSESHNQTGWSKSPKSFWRSVLKRLPSYRFLALTICCNTQGQASCLQPHGKGVADGALPHSTTALQFAEDIKWGQCNPAPMLPSSRFTADLTSEEMGASKHAAAKTAAAAEQKSSPKHTKLQLWGINRMGSRWHQSWKLKILRA